MTFSIMTLSIECHYEECRSAEYRNNLNVILSVVMLSVVALNVVALNVVTLNALPNALAYFAGVSMKFYKVCPWSDKAEAFFVLHVFNSLMMT